MYATACDTPHSHLLVCESVADVCKCLLLFAAALVGLELSSPWQSDTGKLQQDVECHTAGGTAPVPPATTQLGALYRLMLHNWGRCTA